MTMVSTGEISIGGNATSGGLNRSINIELGRAASATSSLNESALRTLAGVPSGAISLSNFYGKSNRTFSLAGVTSLYGARVQGSPGNCFAYYSFATDGDLLGFASPSGGAVTNTDWTLPITGGIGSSYWVRWTIVGSGGTGVFTKIGTDGTWQQLSSALPFGLQTTNNNTIVYRYYDCYFEISSNSAGTNIVASSPTVNLAIEVSN